MRFLACPLLLALAALAGADEPAKSKVPVSGDTDAKFARFDEVMNAFFDKFTFPGAALAVAKDGKIVYSRAFGYSDLDAKQPLKPDALFRICSVSKPITAVAVLRLVDQGKL